MAGSLEGIVRRREHEGFEVGRQAAWTELEPMAVRVPDRDVGSVGSGDRVPATGVTLKQPHRRVSTRRIEEDRRVGRDPGVGLADVGDEVLLWMVRHPPVCVAGGGGGGGLTAGKRSTATVAKSVTRVRVCRGWRRWGSPISARVLAPDPRAEPAQTSEDFSQGVLHERVVDVDAELVAFVADPVVRGEVTEAPGGSAVTLCA